MSISRLTAEEYANITPIETIRRNIVMVFGQAVHEELLNKEYGRRFKFNSAIRWMEFYAEAYEVAKRQIEEYEAEHAAEWREEAAYLYAGSYKTARPY